MKKSACRRIFFHPGARLHPTLLSVYLGQGETMKPFQNASIALTTESLAQSANLFCLDSILNQFDEISLEQLKEEKLLNRVDTKFLFDACFLSELLPFLSSDYFALNVAGTFLQPYRSLYFDTPSFDLYCAHHNGRKPRFKVRMRKYLKNAATFLEIKQKDNRDRTLKSRLSIADIHSALTAEQYDFLQQKTSQDLSPLKPVVWNQYHRITLINKNRPEKLTIDLNFNAFNPKGFIAWNRLIIAELKQENHSTNSPFFQIMRSHCIRPVDFSKYCLSMSLLLPQLKSNKFKSSLAHIQSYLQRRPQYAF